MKKILLITESLGSGGAERQLAGLAVLLKKRGYKVKVVTYYRKQFYESYLKENDLDYELYEKASNKFTRVFYLISLLKRLKPDVVISFLPSVNLSVCLAHLFYNKCKLIVSERSYTRDFNLKARIIFNLYRLADYIVPNSFFEGDNIAVHFPFLKKKIISIQNFIDTDKFPPNISTKKNDDEIIILTVARLIPSKNMLVYIDAISYLVERGYKMKVIWVGNQDNKEYLEKVKNKIQKKNLQNIIYLKGQTTNVVEEYQKADIFCFPTLFEGYPNVICEAMSCGLPVVCSNVCEIPRIVEDGKNGFLFNPMNYKDIANSLCKVFNLNCEEILEMKETNRFKIVNNNNPNVIVEKYISLF